PFPTRRSSDLVALGERLERGERVAADVQRHVRLADLAAHELHGREDRALGAADAEARRALRQRRREQVRGFLANRLRALKPGRATARIEMAAVAREECDEAAGHDFHGVLARHLQAVLAVEPGL